MFMQRLSKHIQSLLAHQIHADTPVLNTKRDRNTAKEANYIF